MKAIVQKAYGPPREVLHLDEVARRHLRVLLEVPGGAGVLDRVCLFSHLASCSREAQRAASQQVALGNSLVPMARS